MWQEIQCIDQLGRCWCVNTTTGERITGHRDGQPDCSGKGAIYSTSGFDLLYPYHCTSLLRTEGIQCVLFPYRKIMMCTVVLLDFSHSFRLMYFNATLFDNQMVD